MEQQTYPAVRVRQTPDAGDLVLFAAPALEIEDWSGVPQRERLGADETVGFQREENPKRLNELIAFYGDPHNVIQNPLLCACRDASKVHFSPTAGSPADGAEIGTLTVQWENLRSLPLVVLLRRVKTNLEARLPELAGLEISASKLAALKERANAEHPELNPPHSDTEDDQPSFQDVDDGASDDSDEADAAVTSVLFSDESHIADFWEELATRVKVLEETGDTFDGESFLGFPKDAMISYLQPVVVVDGQHRLRGAILAAEDAVNGEDCRSEIEQAIEDGASPDDIAQQIKRRVARRLPVSLLLESAPAEHVFQFVVVNQKATPIGRALLGTIVSTSLSNQELAGVSTRLTAAGIPLQDSQAIAYLTRHPESPFRDLVEKGLTGEGTDLLQWNVLGSLVRIFRELKGGKLFHEKIDYADKWRRDRLDASGIVAGSPDDVTKLEWWARADGPWRDVFVRFWSAVRDKLATVDDAEAGNYWGAPRTSNLFNKISLTILAADWFQFLCDRGYAIDTIDDVASHVEEWLDGVKTTYFSRDWKLGGVKKDATGTKAQWAYLWVQYRKDPVQLPQLPQFRQPRAT